MLVLTQSDFDAIRLSVKIALTAKGHEVEEAAYGSTALRWVSKQPFDVALVDLRLDLVIHTAAMTMNIAMIPLTMYGKMDEPGTGEHGKNIKYVTRLLGRDKQVFEVHDLAIGEPNTKVMEMTYTRKK